MSKPLKWLFGGLGAVAVLMLVVALAVVLLLDPVRVRDQLVSVVREQTGRELQIAQPVDLSLFPWLGVALREVRLGNAPGFGDEPLARAEELRVRVKVLPLLAGNLEVDALVVRGLALNLGRNARGETNWSDVRQPVATPPRDARGPTPAGVPQGLGAFMVGGVELSGGRVAWHDQRAKTRYAFDDLEVHTGAIAPGLAVPVRFGARMVAEGTSRNLVLAATGNLQLGERLTALHLPDLDLRVRAEGEGLPAGGIDISARAGVRYDLEAETLELAPVEIAGAGLRLRGEVRGGRLTGDPAFEGQLELAEVKPRTLLAMLGTAAVPTADPAVLNRLAAKLPFKADARAVTLDGLSLTLDDTAVTGRFAVTDLTTGALRFDLAADRLDVDRYLPPGQARPAPSPGQGKASQPKAAGAVVAGGAALPAEVLRGLDVDGSLRVGALKVGGARLSEVRTHWRAQGGVITQTAEAKLYGGSGRTTSTLDAKRAQPAMTLKGALRGIDLDSLLTDTAGQSRLSGTGTIDADLRWNGLSEAEVKRSLGGSARVALRDGALQGFDLDALVQNALAALKGGKTRGGAQQTAFSELTASVSAQNGVLSNHDLQATSALLSVTGAGTIDLPANRIDYLAKATLRDSAQAQLASQLVDLRGTPIPVRFAGNLDAPSITLNVEELLRSKAGQQIQRKVEEKLKGEWGDKLKKFLDR